MIKVQKLTRKYGSVTAVKDISFEIQRGEIVGLLGHNGAGKTTTLKMLTGFLDATAGEIRIAGLDIHSNRIEVQKKIGYLPENAQIYPEMSVCEYLEYVARLREIPENEIPGAIRDALQATGLTDRIHQTIATLSKGYTQRVGVAQAILHKPEILILDEPTNGLDPTQIFSMRGLIKQLAKTATVIISTHIMQEVEAICDRVIIILNGSVAIDSAMKDLQRGNAITVSVKEDLEALRSAVSGIHGVRTVSTLPGKGGTLPQYSIECEGSFEAVAPEIAKTLVNRGFSLYRMSGDQRNLESVFKEVNAKVNAKGGSHHA